MESGRIQRWALALASYEYTIKKGPTDTNADTLSRLPVLAPDKGVPVHAELVLLFNWTPYNSTNQEFDSSRSSLIMNSLIHPSGLANIII